MSRHQSAQISTIFPTFKYSKSLVFLPWSIQSGNENIYVLSALLLGVYISAENYNMSLEITAPGPPSVCLNISTRVWSF
jgi:hypothetical protein